ncbi:MAG: efflux RND transporter periplasmic adaptor subunit [Acidobacteriota bacterium]
MKRFLIATAVLLLFPLTAFSQGPNGGDALQQLVETALKSNPGLKAQRTKVQAAEKRPSQARALPDPTASLEMMMISTDHFDASKALSNGISVGLSQRLPYPGKLKLREQKAQREVTVAQARLSAMESKITGEVKAASYQYALYQRLLSINQDTHDALSAAAQGAAGAYSAGTGTQVDVLLAQTALTKNRADRKDLEKQLRIVKSHLDDLLGGNAPVSLLKRVPLPEPSHILPLQDLLSSLPKTAPDVQIAKNLESVQETDVAIARKNFKPDFMVEGRYRHHDVSMGGGNYLTAMVGITLPFFHYKSRYRPALQQAELERQNAGYQIETGLRVFPVGLHGGQGGLRNPPEGLDQLFPLPRAGSHGPGGLPGIACKDAGNIGTSRHGVPGDRKMKKTLLTALGFTLLVGIFLIGRLTGSSAETPKEQPVNDKRASSMKDMKNMDMKLSKTSNRDINGTKRKILYWRAPMDPTYISKKPGKSPMGMDLVPVYADEVSSGEIRISPTVVQDMGVTTTTVKEAPFERTIRTYGSTTWDESTLAALNTKVGGWIEKLYVNETGQMVKKGQPLLAIYSPDLVATQRDFLSAVDAAKALKKSNDATVASGGDALLRAARERLRFWDIRSRSSRRPVKSGRAWFSTPPSAVSSPTAAWSWATTSRPAQTSSKSPR